jgi:long-chain acyl-CoA synthetase
VYADPNKAKPIAIIVPTEKPLNDIAKELGVKGEHLEEFVHDDRVNTAVLKQVQEAGRKAGLAGIEIISGIVLAEEEWTPQNVSGHAQDICSHYRAETNQQTRVLLHPRKSSIARPS